MAISMCACAQGLSNRFRGIDPETTGACGVVDLHTGVADLEDRRLEELYERSRLVPLSDVEIRILGAKDQLRHLCLHLIRHGAWRPLWLCDVGAALESLPPSFDWDYCWSGDPRLTDWLRCAVGLASQLLDAQAPSPADVPRWIVNSILQVWRRGAEGNDAVVQPLSASLRNWGGLPPIAASPLAQPDPGRLQDASKPVQSFAADSNANRRIFTARVPVRLTQIGSAGRTSRGPIRGTSGANSVTLSNGPGVR